MFFQHELRRRIADVRQHISAVRAEVLFFLKHEHISVKLSVNTYPLGKVIELIILAVAQQRAVVLLVAMLARSHYICAL